MVRLCVLWCVFSGSKISDLPVHQSSRAEHHMEREKESEKREKVNTLIKEIYFFDLLIVFSTLTRGTIMRFISRIKAFKFLSFFFGHNSFNESNCQRRQSLCICSVRHLQLFFLFWEGDLQVGKK